MERRTQQGFGETGWVEAGEGVGEEGEPRGRHVRGREREGESLASRRPWPAIFAAPGSLGKMRGL